MWRPGDGIHDNDWEEQHRDAGDITQPFDGLAGASEWVVPKTFQPISSQDFYKELWEFLSNTGMKESDVILSSTCLHKLFSYKMAILINLT